MSGQALSRADLDVGQAKGQLIPIEELIDLAERRLAPHPQTVIDLTDKDDKVVLDLEGLVRDFMEEEEEDQARNEEE